MALVMHFKVASFIENYFCLLFFQIVSMNLRLSLSLYLIYAVCMLHADSGFVDAWI